MGLLVVVVIVVVLKPPEIDTENSQGSDGMPTYLANTKIRCYAFFPTNCDFHLPSLILIPFPYSPSSRVIV